MTISGIKKYYKQYQWSNVFAMLHNQNLDPEICEEDFDGHLVVITGATSGIGRVAAKKYAAHGADLLCINRNEEKSKILCREMKEEFNAKCDYFIADFSNLIDIHNVARKLASLDRDIDVLIHNAGLFVTTRTLTPDNIETVFQVDHLAAFIINYALKEKLKAQRAARIIYVNSEAHRFAAWGLNMKDLSWAKHAYSGSKSYGAAKLAQLLSMIKFDEYFQGSGVTINAMHPGNVITNSGQNNGPLYKFFKRNFVDRSAKSPDISAEALYYLGVSDKMKGISGKFFHLTAAEEPAPPALDKEAADQLWEISLELSGLL